MKTTNATCQDHKIMRTLIPIVTAGFFSIAIAANSQAALVLQPAGLNPGDQYRLVFVTSTTRDATSPNIADYNNHVQAAANASPTVNSWALTWNAIGSTSAVHARDNTSTDPIIPGIPIYLVDGTKIADNYADLWDGGIDMPINRTELDSTPDSISVWMGTDADGHSLFHTPLGATPIPMLGSFATAGSPDDSDSSWVMDAVHPTSLAWPLYGMSGVITAVPEPSAFLLGLVGFGGVAWRRVLNPTKK